MPERTDIVAEALALTDGDPAWLCDQLERWPKRVHPERTTSIRYLDETASAILSAAALGGDHAPPLDQPMVERMTAALAAFRRQHAGRHL
jgi:hypothetical protein